jgi:hypothetical protein
MSITLSKDKCYSREDQGKPFYLGRFVASIEEVEEYVWKYRLKYEIRKYNIFQHGDSHPADVVKEVPCAVWPGPTPEEQQKLDVMSSTNAAKEIEGIKRLWNNTQSNRLAEATRRAEEAQAAEKRKNEEAIKRRSEPSGYQGLANVGMRMGGRRTKKSKRRHRKTRRARK